MAALFEDDSAAQVHRGARVAAVDGNLREREQHVQPRHGLRRGLHAVHLPGGLLAHGAEQLVLELDGFVVRAEDAALQLLELRRDEPLAVRERLFAGVFGRGLVLVGVADFYVIAEHAVVADPELRDAGALALARLDFRNHAPAAAHVALEQVQLLTEARLYQAAFPDGKRRVVHNRALEQVPHVPERVDFPINPAQEGAFCVFEQIFQRRQAPRRIGKAPQLPRVGGAVDDAGHQALQVVDAGELLREAVAQDAVARELLDGVQPAVDARRVQQRALEPAADQPLAHRGAGAVQHPQQGAALLFVAHGLQQLQVAAGRQVQPHVLRAAVKVEGVHALQARALGLAQVAEQRAEGAGHFGHAVQAQLRGVFFMELPRHGCGRRPRVELPVVQQLQAGVQACADEFRQAGEVQRALVHQQLPRREARKLVLQPGGQLRRVFARKQRGVRLARGDVRKADAGAVVPHAERADEVVAPLVEHAALQHRAGRNHADDAPFDQALRELGVLHLLADGDLVPVRNQPRHIGLVAVERHAAHRGALRLPAVAPREGEVQLPRHELGVVVEHLVKIAEAEKQDGVRVLLFHLEILPHHRGKCRQRLPPPLRNFPSAQRQPAHDAQSPPQAGAV